jgi:hypothetical protein
MDLRDPETIRQLIASEREIHTAERMSNLESRSALGQIKQLQGQVMDIAGNKLPAPVMSAVGAGLNAITSGLDKVFGLGPRETQIQTAKDMADIGARRAVRRFVRGEERARGLQAFEERAGEMGLSTRDFRTLERATRGERARARLASTGFETRAEFEEAKRAQKAQNKLKRRK